MPDQMEFTLEWMYCSTLQQINVSFTEQQDNFNQPATFNRLL